MYVGFFPSREMGDERSEFLSWGPQLTWTITDHSAQKFCGPKQWTVNNIVVLIRIILCDCKFDRPNWTKEEENNNCKQHNPRKIKRFLMKEEQMKYIVTTGKERKKWS